MRGGGGRKNQGRRGTAEKERGWVRARKKERGGAGEEMGRPREEGNVREKEREQGGDKELLELLSCRVGRKIFQIWGNSQFPQIWKTASPSIRKNNYLTPMRKMKRNVVAPAARNHPKGWQ